MKINKDSLINQKQRDNLDSYVHLPDKMSALHLISLFQNKTALFINYRKGNIKKCEPTLFQSTHL